MSRLGIILGMLVCGLCVWVQAGWVVDGVPESEGSGSTNTVTNVVIDASADETFPVLRLELGDNWTDFEVKASTDNFASLIYHIVSTTNSPPSIGDTNVLVFFTDDFSGAPRAWRSSGVARAIYSQLSSTGSVVNSVVVCPSHECGRNWQDWMSKTNSMLKWSYCRLDMVGSERNAAGTKMRWNAIVPVEWRKTRYAP